MFAPAMTKECRLVVSLHRLNAAMYRTVPNTLYDRPTSVSSISKWKFRRLWNISLEFSIETQKFLKIQHVAVVGKA